MYSHRVNISMGMYVYVRTYVQEAVVCGKKKLIMSFSDPITCATYGKHWTEHTINGHTCTDTGGILSQVSMYVCMYVTSISVGVTGKKCHSHSANHKSNTS